MLHPLASSPAMSCCRRTLCTCNQSTSQVDGTRGRLVVACPCARSQHAGSVIEHSALQVRHTACILSSHIQDRAVCPQRPPPVMSFTICVLRACESICAPEESWHALRNLWQRESASAARRAPHWAHSSLCVTACAWQRPDRAVSTRDRWSQHGTACFAMSSALNGSRMGRGRQSPYGSVHCAER